MKETKSYNLVNELTSLIPKQVYTSLIECKVYWLHSIDISISLVSSKFAIKEEKINYGGKVVWDKEAVGEEYPLKILINILNYKGIELLSIFLHECGHIMDRGDLNIELQSKESELSAWKHAISDFNKISNKDEEDKAVFKNTAKRSLMSYKVSDSKIDKVLSNII